MLQTMAVIRVRFPDNLTLEVTFHPHQRPFNSYMIFSRKFLHAQNSLFICISLLLRSKLRICPGTFTLLASLLLQLSTSHRIYQKMIMKSMKQFPSFKRRSFH